MTVCAYKTARANRHRPQTGMLVINLRRWELRRKKRRGQNKDECAEHEYRQHGYPPTEAIVPNSCPSPSKPEKMAIGWRLDSQQPAVLRPPALPSPTRGAPTNGRTSVTSPKRALIEDILDRIPEGSQGLPAPPSMPGPIVFPINHMVIQNFKMG